MSYNQRETHKELRTEKHIDRADGFMSGHQIKKTRSRDNVRIPDWMQDDRAVRLFLYTKFPKMFDAEKPNLTAKERRLATKQRKAATLWMYVIVRHFRNGIDATTVEYEAFEEGRSGCPRMSRRVYREIRKSQPWFRPYDPVRLGVQRVVERSCICDIARQIRREAVRQNLETEKQPKS